MATLSFTTPFRPTLGFHALPQALAESSAQVHTPRVVWRHAARQQKPRASRNCHRRDWTFRHVHWLAKRAGITWLTPRSTLCPVGRCCAGPSRSRRRRPAHQPLGDRATVCQCGKARAKTSTTRSHGRAAARLAADVSRRGDTWRDPATRVKPLRANTDRALREGVGVPPCVDGQVFWGVDSLPMLSEHLRA